MKILGVKLYQVDKRLKTGHIDVKPEIPLIVEASAGQNQPVIGTVTNIRLIDGWLYGDITIQAAIDVEFNLEKRSVLAVSLMGG